MFRGYWRYGIAIAGLACCNPINHHAYAQQRTPDSQNAAKNNVKPSDLSAVENKLDSIASAIKSNQDDPKAAAEEQRAKDDLNAQENMALWAFWMFVAATVTTLFTGAGILLIWRTLIHTRRASRYAGVAARMARKATVASQDMALETQSATKAMDGANTIAREIGNAQVRAYLSVRKVDVTFSSAEWHYKIKFQIENTGQSPAKNIRLCAIFHVVDFGSMLVDPIENRWDFPEIHGGIEDLELHFSLSEGMVKNRQVGIPTFLYLAVFWDDVFGVECDQLGIWSTPHEITNVAENGDVWLSMRPADASVSDSGLIDHMRGKVDPQKPDG